MSSDNCCNRGWDFSHFFQHQENRIEIFPGSENLCIICGVNSLWLSKYLYEQKNQRNHFEKKTSRSLREHTKQFVVLLNQNQISF
ncbi:hypothetical protein, partial [uncultured Chryseobacterium sp.]|uniref:hypothetical protein n=1 Tax=uncultured Chryseobacterium sp. TaxID=259322 RepID=UPI0027DBAF87